MKVKRLLLAFILTCVATILNASDALEKEQYKIIYTNEQTCSLLLGNIEIPPKSTYGIDGDELMFKATVDYALAKMGKGKKWIELMLESDFRPIEFLIYEEPNTIIKVELCRGECKLCPNNAGYIEQTYYEGTPIFWSGHAAINWGVDIELGMCINDTIIDLLEEEGE